MIRYLELFNLVDLFPNLSACRNLTQCEASEYGYWTFFCSRAKPRIAMNNPFKCLVIANEFLSRCQSIGFLTKSLGLQGSIYGASLPKLVFTAGFELRTFNRSAAAFRPICRRLSNPGRVLHTAQGMMGLSIFLNIYPVYLDGPWSLLLLIKRTGANHG